MSDADVSPQVEKLIDDVRAAKERLRDASQARVNANDIFMAARAGEKAADEILMAAQEALLKAL
jgi:hypothetical protein